jgi:hypothetical protein
MFFVHLKNLKNTAKLMSEELASTGRKDHKV